MKGYFQARLIETPEEFMVRYGIERAFPSGQPHHVTLAYGVEFEGHPLAEWVGREVEFRAAELCRSQGHQFVAVETVCSVFSGVGLGLKDNLHVTVSYADGETPGGVNSVMQSLQYGIDKYLTGMIKARIEFVEWE